MGLQDIINELICKYNEEILIQIGKEELCLEGIELDKFIKKYLKQGHYKLDRTDKNDEIKHYNRMNKYLIKRV